MIAIIKVGGHQALVQAGEQIEVDKLDTEVGKTIKFETLLLSEEDGSSFQVGDPVIKGVEVEAKVLEHGRSKKVTVFKMKPRKRYKRTKGHRQDYTVIEITKVGGSAKKAAPAQTKKKDTPKEEEKKAAPKKPAAKKPAIKKPAAKKAPAKKKE